MNILCVTQSSGIDIFNALARRLSPPGSGGRRAFIVSDSAYYYKKFLLKNRDFESDSVVLKEWDVTAKRNHSFDPDLLKRYEEELGGPGIFGALFTDRRMVYGPLCGFTQDERRRMPDSALLSILQEALVRIDRLLEEVKPDLICGFVCVTFMDYLLALFGRARGIRYINLRTARVANFFLMESTINDPSPEFLSVYRAFADGSRAALPEAKTYIADMRDKGLKYEGVVPACATPPAIAATLSDRVRSLAGAAYFSL
ncbi:MAG: hypothetical protein ACT4OY_08915, partial [Alphaproteobacteria bacterium]